MVGICIQFFISFSHCLWEVWGPFPHFIDEELRIRSPKIEKVEKVPWLQSRASCGLLCSTGGMEGREKDPLGSFLPPSRCDNSPNIPSLSSCHITVPRAVTSHSSLGFCFFFTFSEKSILLQHHDC